MSADTPRLRQDEYFRKALEEDFEFIQLCLLLIAKSLPVKNIDIFWHRRLLPYRSAFSERLGTRDALSSFRSTPLVQPQTMDPNPRFCNLINDFGRRESVSCARSDVPAEERARRSRKPQVYVCHAGLIDICVPIFADDEYLGCIFCGQVLLQEANERRFQEVCDRVSDLTYLDLDSLHDAYFEIPVVSQKDIEAMTSILEIFADYLARSRKRLQTILETETRYQRDLCLRQQEFASLLLSGQRFDLREMQTEAKNLGFTRPPSQVLVVEADLSGEGTASLFNGDIVHNRVHHLLSRLIEHRRNTLLSSFRRGEFVILLAPAYARNPAHGKILVEEFAQRILLELSKRGFGRVRIGIGREKSSLKDLAGSYEEAITALAHHMEVERPIRVFRDSSMECPTIGNHLLLVLEAFERASVEDFLTAAHRYLFSLRNKHPEALLYELAFLLDSIAVTAKKVNVSPASLIPEGASWYEDLSHLQSAPQLLTQVRDILSAVSKEMNEIFNRGKLQRKLMAARNYIDQHYAEPISLSDLAAYVGLSESYFSRQFRKATGLNFQNYLQQRRICASMSLLLEPKNSITDCAFHVGFNDRAYFSKVFKGILGVTPTQFANDPSGSMGQLRLFQKAEQGRTDG